MNTILHRLKEINMIFKCDKCNKEFNLMTKAKHCPVCGSAIEKIDLEKKIADLYLAGKTDKEIEDTIHISVITVDQILAKAAINGHIDSEKVIQMEYEDAIYALINDSWDGKLKTLKTKLPSECNYITINYFVRKKRRSAAAERHRLNSERVVKIRELIHAGKDIETIVNETGSSIYMAERILVEEIREDKSLANPYINNEYKSQILDIVNNPEWDGKLKSVKDQLPEIITYTNIKATIEQSK